MPLSPEEINKRICSYSHASLGARSLEVRNAIVDSFVAGSRGHIGAAFSVVEILLALYDHVMNYRAHEPNWSERDRFILSKGHGCLSLYALLAEKGFIDAAHLQKFCHGDGLLGGHPEHKVAGVEASTGALGHGLSIGVGMALALRNDQSASQVFVVCGDGECNEGSVWEAAMSASKHGLNNLTVLVDYNKQQSYASTYEVLDLEPFAQKWQSFGFETSEVDGHDVQALVSQLQQQTPSQVKPRAIICHTIKGRGVSFVETNLDWHHRNKFDDALIAKIRAELLPVNLSDPTVQTIQGKKS